MADSEDTNPGKAKYPLNTRERRWRCFIAFTAIVVVIAFIAILVILLAAGGAFVIGDVPECTDNSTGASGQDDGDVSVKKDIFGQMGGSDVLRYTLTNKHGYQLQVISYGATVTTLKVPDKDGKLADVVLGYDDFAGYFNGTSYFGSTVGRVANRIAGARFMLDGVQYNLSANENNENTLHGGAKGFSMVNWNSKMSGNSVIFTFVSPDGDQGFPGEVTSMATYRLTNENEMIIDYQATTTKATPINLSHHSYFNLGGQGNRTIEDHTIAIYANKYTPVDGKLIPTGTITSVIGTDFDLLGPKTLTAANLNKILPNKGYDNNFCVNGTTGLKLMARVTHPPSGRVMTVYSDQPGVQLYNAMHLGSEIGKSGVAYPKWGGLCLETQNYPDAINQPNFPDSVLRPGSIYKHQVIYKFSTGS